MTMELGQNGTPASVPASVPAVEQHAQHAIQTETRTLSVTGTFDQDGLFTPLRAAGPTLTMVSTYGMPTTLEGVVAAGALFGIATKALGCEEGKFETVDSCTNLLDMYSDADAIPGCYKASLKLAGSVANLVRTDGLIVANGLGIMKHGGDVVKKAAKSALLFNKGGVFEFAEGTVKNLKLAKNTGSIVGSLAVIVETKRSMNKVADGVAFNVVPQEGTVKYIEIATAISVIAFAAFNIFTALSTIAVSPIAFPVLLSLMVVAITVRECYKIHVKRMLNESGASNTAA